MNTKRLFVFFIWALGAILWLAHPFVMLEYFKVTQRLGWYPTNADSILIPIIALFYIAALGFLFFFDLCRAATRGICEPVGLFRWDKSRPWRSIVLTFLFLLLAANSLDSAFKSYCLLLAIRASSIPLSEDVAIYRIGLSGGWIVFWLFLRSCFIAHKRDRSAEQAMPSDGHKPSISVPTADSTAPADAH